MQIAITYPETKDLRDRMRGEVEKYLAQLGSKVSYKTIEAPERPGTLGTPELVSTIIECAANTAQFAAALIPLLLQIYVWRKAEKDKEPTNRATVEIEGKKLTLPASRSTIKTFLKTVAGARKPATTRSPNKQTSRKRPKKK